MSDTWQVWKKIAKDPAGLLVVEFEVIPHSVALLLVDMQKYSCYRHIGLGPVLLKEMQVVAEHYFSCISGVVVPNAQRLLAFFRDNKLRVTYTCVGPLLPDASDMIERRRLRDESRLRAAGIDHFFYPGTLEHEVIDELKPKDGEMIFNKNSSSAFNSTNIDQILRNMRIDSLVIAGVATNYCVEITARDAADRGYKCILVTDACAAMSKDAHEMTMTNFAAQYGKVMTTQDVIKYLESRFCTE